MCGVERSGITFQPGPQSRSNHYFRMACELVRNNRIGRLQRVEVGLNKGHSKFGKTPEQLSETPLATPPPYVDFDLWLGPAPARKFTPKIHHPMQWRYNLEYSCGMLTDFAAHQLDIMQWALGKDGVEPVAIENIKGRLPPSTDLYNTLAEPFSFEIVYGDGTRVFVSSEYTYGCRFYGENGKQIYVTNARSKPIARLVRERSGKRSPVIRSGNRRRTMKRCTAGRRRFRRSRRVSRRWCLPCWRTSACGPKGLHSNGWPRKRASRMLPMRTNFSRRTCAPRGSWMCDGPRDAGPGRA